MNDQIHAVRWVGSESKVKGAWIQNVMSPRSQIEYELVPLPTGIPAENLRAFDRGHVADVALLLPGYRPADPGTRRGHNRASRYPDPDTAAHRDAATHADPAANLHPDVDPDPAAGPGDSDGHIHADQYGHVDADQNGDIHANQHSHIYNDQHSHRNCDGEPHRQPDADKLGFAHTDLDPNPHTHLHAHLHADSHRNRHGDSDFVANAYGDLNTTADVYGGCDGGYRPGEERGARTVRPG